ncbi:MAG: NYN domain-containing protein [Verrucomicrobiales bacterium]
MPARYLIVDGHSIIFHWPDLRRLHESAPRRARAELVRRLTVYQDNTEERVVIVFDGKGDRSRKAEALPRDVQVVYASSGATADSVIEKLVAQHAGVFELTVATGDEAERITISVLGAGWLSPDRLRERLSRASTATAHQWRIRKSPTLETSLGNAFPAETKEEEGPS